MGAKGKNFHANVAIRMGYEDEVDEIQDLYLDGQEGRGRRRRSRRELIEQLVADRAAGQDPRRPRALARVDRDDAADRRRRRDAAHRRGAGARMSGDLETDHREGPRRPQGRARAPGGRRAAQASPSASCARRELGDLSENAEYHAAKDDQAHLETRILKLRQRLRSAQVVEVASGSDIVAFGSTVTFVDEGTGKEQAFTIVGTTEQDLKAGKLSSESPIAQALMGAKVGDVVAVQTPGGKRDMRVTKIG